MTPNTLKSCIWRCLFPLAGNTPARAVRAFLDQLQHAVSCVTHAKLLASGYQPAADPHALTFAGPRELPLRGPQPWHLALVIHYQVVRVDADRSAWRVTTATYAFELLFTAGQRVVAYHWHPQPHNRVRVPHLHVPQHTVPVDLSRVHLPTPRVSLEPILRFAIEELGVVPLRRDWRAVLDETERIFLHDRTWG
jgi:hypothetical protein